MIDFSILQEQTKQLIIRLYLKQTIAALPIAPSVSHSEMYRGERSTELESKKTLIVGLSGGADSVFLLHLLVKVATTTPLTLIVAHLNHGWRGAADDVDLEFCRKLAQYFNLTFISAHACEIITAKSWNGSQEELGRYQRHTFLQNTAKQLGACAIALGHHAQDQEENFFIRLMRGASLEGLCGMKEISDSKIPLIRPLLHTSRADIEQWLTIANQSWCQDSDNKNPNFLRNRIRHELLPILRNIDSRFEQSFARTLNQLEQEQKLIDDLVKNTFTTIFDPASKGDLAQFKKLPPMLQGHVFKKLLITNDMPFSISEGFIDEALRFLNSPRGGSHQLNQRWVLTKKSTSFWLTLLTNEGSL